MADRVVSEQQLIDRLKALGFSRTTERTATGTFWKSSKGGHILVPDAIQGFYPDWLLSDLEGVIGKLNPWTYKKELH
jgi:hypothetical protein